jgi:hypothetical protein
MFGCSVADTVSWLAALGLGVSSTTGSGEKNTNSEVMKGLSIALFIVSQAISKFNDYNNYKKVHQYQAAQRAVVQAREIIKQRQLLETTLQVTQQAKALLAPTRGVEAVTSLNEKNTRWQEMQLQLRQIFDPLAPPLSLDRDSVAALRSFSSIETESRVESLV